MTNEGTFACNVCGTELKDDEESAEMMSSQKRLGKLMGQVNGIIDALKRVDEIVVPQNNFQSALEHAVPVSLDTQNLSQQNLSKSNSDVRLSTSSPSITVDFSADKETDEKRERNCDKQVKAAQNILPEWHATSTISGSITRAGAKDAALHSFRTETVNEVQDTKTDITSEKSALDAYYATLRAKQKEESEFMDSENVDDEEDDDFLDVTTATSLQNKSTDYGSVKRKTENLNSDSDIQNKRTKSIEENNSLPPIVSTNGITDGDTEMQESKKNVIINGFNEDDEDDEDEADFEDV